MYLIIIALAVLYPLIALGQPVAPTELTAYHNAIGNSSATAVILRWSHPGADSFLVRASSSPDGPYTLLSTVSAPTCTDSISLPKRFYNVSAWSGGVESEPSSNHVGYVKFVGVAQSYTAFGLPFKFWDLPAGSIPDYGVISTRPSDIVGDQALCGSIVAADMILRQDTGNLAYRSASAACSWAGTLEISALMGPGRAYWYHSHTTVNRNVVLAGEVDNTGNYLNVLMPLGTYTPYSWRDSRTVHRNQLNLLSDGFGDRDMVIMQGGAGTFFWYRQTDGTWQPAAGPLYVEPRQAYWIFNREYPVGSDSAWHYNYDASGNP